MKLIPLTQGKFAQVDDEDYEWLNQFKWHIYESKKNKFYAARNVWLNGKNKQISLHRFIMNSPVNFQIDHRDGDGLNNQKSNLRICNSQQNSMNRGSRIGASSKYKGVYFDAYSNKWRAEIKLNGVYIYRKIFDSEIEAAKQYDIWANELFGEFAGLNFPYIYNRLVI